MVLNHRLLKEINHLVGSDSIDIDDLRYTNQIKTYSLPKIIDFNWQNILETPPSNGSKQTLDELIYVANLTLKRTPQELELIRKIDDDPSFPIQETCKIYNVDFPKEIFNQWYINTKNLIYAIKYHFNRPRPQQLANFYNLKIDAIDSDTAHTPSYPSGHTVYAKLAANIVLANYPNIGITDSLNTAVADVAYARCCQGVHFPSDNQASLIVANFIFQHLYNKIGV